MLLAVALCPHPPLLVPEVAAAAAPELDPLRDACDAAVQRLLASEPDVVVVVGQAPTNGWLPGTAGTLAAYGVPVTTGSGAPTLPLAHTIGCWLLDRAGWPGRRAYLGAGQTADVEDFVGCADEVRSMARAAVLTMGDGSARRSERAPGYVDARSGEHDAALRSAWQGGPEAVTRLDRALARDMLAAGWPAWQATARAALGTDWQADVLYDDAPYGVGYLVATWTRP